MAKQTCGWNSDLCGCKLCKPFCHAIIRCGQVVEHEHTRECEPMTIEEVLYANKILEEFMDFGCFVQDRTGDEVHDSLKRFCSIMIKSHSNELHNNPYSAFENK